VKVSTPTSIEVHPATEDRFDDVRTVLEPKSKSPQACWCLTYRLSNAENSTLSGEARPTRLRDLCRQTPPPGVVAYLDKAPAGWCAVSPREAYERLNRSRTIQRLDALPVWSIVCLVVRSGFRQQGIGSALIQGAVDFAFTHGAPAVEAYPIETLGSRVNSSLAFTGTTKMFLAAGFAYCAETEAKSAGAPRVIMRRITANQSDA
jgi:GNAT superfamily N-acetyltransferase